ncbi:MarR family transcriptional regulator [Sphingomonas sp.]|uniref:MarR family winged helix-turn-helix transcriptional regulator n=1 Tax=Sphingomonas sp. TaxID=28214 RepID=UPI001D1DC587|nr:MarR family transcriptional regulator [Sphingomonas sp.]MBX9796857.1 MarR family transcriptional regulator [Sphingomonas sp.]
MALPAASALFLREAELRRGIELLAFGHGALLRAGDARLAAIGLGRAHQRALYFIARRPDATISALLGLLSVTKQSLGRVLNDLAARDLIETRPGDQDRRQKLVRLTEKGRALEAELFELLRARLAAAYAEAGQGAVSGFWAVLEGLTPPEQKRLLGGFD